MYLKKLIAGLLFLALYACGSYSNNTAAPAEKNKTTTELPSGLQKLVLDSGGTLNAYITIDGDTGNRKIMDINPVGAGSASVSIPGLSRALHTVLIRYEYTIGGITYIVASANKEIDLSSGSEALNFVSTDYDLSAFDDDGDGINNAAELKAGSDLGDSGDPHMLFTSPVSISVNENTAVTGYRAAVTDVSGDSITFGLIQSLSGPDDGAQFNIDSNTGRLSFKAAADFEVPKDTDQDNIYQLLIVASDGTNEVFQTLRLSVTDISNDTPFITRWKTDNPGLTDDNQIEISTIGGGYNYAIDWGDQQINTGVKGNITHTYAVAGTYTVSISGDFPRIFFDTLNPSDNAKLVSIERWGDIIWQSMGNAFAGCVNLAGNAPDIPNLSQVTDMAFMFNGASSFNQALSVWDVSSVTNMRSMFRGASSFNQALSAWDVSSVTNMHFMFGGASSFNQDLSRWDVSSVTNMVGMFVSASSFNQGLSVWDVSPVTNMENMFRGASAFNQDLSAWDVSSVTNMESMFRVASAFNQDLSRWDVSSVTNMANMFDGARSFNQALNTWDVSSVTSMLGMFNNIGSSFNQALNSWNVSSVKNMSAMFFNASSFNQDLSAWDVSTVKNMFAMFNGANSFNQNIGTWDVSSVTSMLGMLNNTSLSTSNYDALLLGWSAQSLQAGVDFSAGNAQYSSSSQPARDTLTDAFGWTLVDGGIDERPFITRWKTDNPGLTDNNQIEISTVGGGYNYSIDWGDQQINTGVTGNITHTYTTAGTYTVSISGDFPRIFFNRNSLSDNKKLVSIEQWGSNVWQSMSQAFFGCGNLTGNASDVPNLSQVTDMLSMFEGSSFNQPLNTWDVSSVTNMFGMFGGASAFNQDLSAWDVSSVTNMAFMFINTGAFNQDIGSWDVSSVTDMSGMFIDANLSTSNYDALLLGWSVQALRAGVLFSVGNTQYSSSSQPARDMLTSVGWTVVDGGIATVAAGITP